MRTYIIKYHYEDVRDWRVIIDERDATIELIGERVRELTYNGMDVGDLISVWQSEMEASELELPR